MKHHGVAPGVFRHALSRNTIDDHQVNILQPSDRFPQGTNWQAGTVADTPRPIKDRNFNVPGQGVVLESIVTEQEVAQALIEGHASRSQPLGVNHHRASGLGRQHHRFIPGLGRVSVWSHQQGDIAGVLAAVSA